MKKYTQIGKHSVWDNFEQSGNFENNERRFLGLSRVKVFKDSTATVIVTDGKRAFSYSRTGTQFKTLGNATKEIKNLYEENKLIQKSKRGTKVATVKASPKKSAKIKTVKKTTNKKVMSVVKTESKGKRVSEKVLRASNKPNDKVLYVVLRMKKLVVAQMQENAVKGKKEAKEVKQIVRAFSNQMTGISAGIKDAKLEELKAIAIKLKTVVKDINVSKYNSKMKDIFSGLAENYPQPTREATKFSIEKDFLDF